MTDLGLLTLIVGALALLSLAAWVWHVWPRESPFEADLERRYQAVPEHFRR